MECKKKELKPEFMDNILDDIFHTERPICQIIQPNGQKKQDYFKLFRPKPYTCLDYNISQTDTKMNAGDTKIHVQQTTAEYVPGSSEVPPPSLRKRYFRGGPPQWKFIDEIWRCQQDEKQKLFKVEFKKRVAKRKKTENFFMNYEHDKAVALVGPEWYQELSPKQIVVVDDLKNCILKDLNEDTIVSTKENIALLGLTLQPKHRHIKKALKNCFRCPIEFLLILYQLIDPQRKKYSINDRILLSAVVHLTIKDTLKELHVRIPSPPPPPKTVKAVPKKKKQLKYDSPYLIPFTFKKEPQKFTGLYTDLHVQHPQSPYFCYLNELKKMKEQRRDSCSPAVKSTEDEIEIELQLAQTIYEKLVDFRPVPMLLKPSKYIPCHLKTKLNVSKNEETIKKGVEQLLHLDSPDEQEVCDAETEITEELSAIRDDFSDNVDKCLVSNPECDKNNEKRQDDAGNIEFEDDLISERESYQNEFIISKSKCTQPKICEQEGGKKCYKKNSEKTVCYVTKTKQESFCSCSGLQRIGNISGICTPSLKEKKLCNKTNFVSNEVVLEDVRRNNKCKHIEQLNLYNEMYHVIRPNRGENKPCKCKQRCKRLTETPLCQCKQCQDDRKKRSINYVIAGLKETEFNNTVSIIDRVVTEKTCECLKKYENKIKEYEMERKKEAKNSCSCYKETKKLVETSFCQCEKCQEDRKIKAVKYIISGIKECQSEHLRIIEGISLRKPCECIKNYEKRIQEYESYQTRKKMIFNIKKLDKKLVIGGVVNTPEGPMYVISGMRFPIYCSCAKKGREEMADKHMQAVMPHAPPGRVKYQIVGVQERPEGNVYILGETIPTEDCECMNLFKTFEQEHSVCNRLYEDYLAKMKKEYDEFVKEMSFASDNAESSCANELDLGGELENEKTDLLGKLKNQENSNSEKKTFPNREVTEERHDLTCETDGKEPQMCEKEARICEKIPTLCAFCATVTASKCCSCGNPYYLACCNCGKIQEVEECTRCYCGGQVIECVDCTCGSVEEEEKVLEEEKQTLKRFFIFKKFLCKPKWKTNLIKRALQSMAEDDYPLAKLPECYKLPHFKLWMQMRCRKFWTKTDRFEYILKSKILWRHCNVCNIWRMCRPKLKISQAEGRLLNWSKADYCRKLVNDCLSRFYRRVQQNRIHFGREFFPTTLSYEFPFRTWRDCYFAYTPVKENEVYAKFVWKKFEYKNFAEMQRFCG